MRLLYAERRRSLAAALIATFENRVTVELASGGMHLLARFPNAADDTLLAKRSAQIGLSLTALSSLAMAHDAGQGLLLGFTNTVPAEACSLVARLASVIDRLM
jgi:GntR family transcriptional regulator/MocR family aminotransferase